VGRTDTAFSRTVRKTEDDLRVEPEDDGEWDETKV
jgi:hypothetical protein